MIACSHSPTHSMCALSERVQYDGYEPWWALIHSLGSALRIDELVVDEELGAERQLPHCDPSVGQGHPFSNSVRYSWKNGGETAENTA